MIRSRPRTRSVSLPTRNRLFSEESRINIRKSSFIPRVLTLANDHEELDIFEYNKRTFKRKVV